MPHIHTGDGQFDFTISGYLVYKNQTLLIKHKYLPIWTPPAGHIEPDQTPVDAVFAEIEQESGIDASHLEMIETASDSMNFERGDSVALPLPFDIEHHAITDTHRHINLSYIVKTDTNHVQPGAGESNTFKWFTAEELQNFTETNDSIRNAALYALKYVEQSSNSTS